MQDVTFVVLVCVGFAFVVATLLVCVFERVRSWRRLIEKDARDLRKAIEWRKAVEDDQWGKT